MRRNSLKSLGLAGLVLSGCAVSEINSSVDDNVDVVKAEGVIREPVNIEEGVVEDTRICNELKLEIYLCGKEKASHCVLFTLRSPRTGLSYPASVLSERVLGGEEMMPYLKQFAGKINNAEKPPRFMTTLFCDTCVTFADYPGSRTRAFAVYSGGISELRSLYREWHPGSVDFIVPDRVLEDDKITVYAVDFYGHESERVELHVGRKEEGRRWLYESEDEYK